MRAYIKPTVLTIFSVSLSGLLLFLVYLLFLQLSEYRPPALVTLQVSNPHSQAVPINQSLSALTYNIGFGAYTPEFSFFFEGGAHSKAFSTQSAKQNMLANAHIINALELDFLLLQEVDINTPRGGHFDQMAFLQEHIKQPYSYTYAINHYVKFLAFPLLDMSGYVNSGLLTGAKYQVKQAQRINLPAYEQWPERLVFEKPCLTLYRMPTENNKELILINTHLSAYDEGGKARKAQLMALNEILTQEYAKGNYVLVGGDWNHVYPGLDPEHFSKPYGIELAAYYHPFPVDIFNPKHYQLGGDVSLPTNRSVARNYIKHQTYTSVLDWFLLSDNIQIERVQVQQTEFAFSDHQPVLLRFRLKP